MNKWHYDKSRMFPITSSNPLKLFNNENKVLVDGARPKPEFEANSDDDKDIVDKVHLIYKPHNTLVIFNLLLLTPNKGSFTIPPEGSFSRQS
jgi:hypothetical protein